MAGRILIGCERLSHEWPGKVVLVDQTLAVNEGERIGVVGTNGGGKSTLLEVIARRLEPDDGTVTYRGGVSVGLLGQDDDFGDTETVGHAVVGDLPAYEWASDPRIREVIDALLDDVDWEGAVGALSGGQRRRVDLARVLVGRWDVLLMDEPTNHLDLSAITWLASHLKRRWPEGGGALLVVTHDRWFLDEVCGLMWEVHDGRVDPFEGGYSAYIQQRVERQRLAEVAEARRQSILRKELNWLAHGAKARTSKPRFRVEAARALVAEAPPLRDTVELRRMAVARLGKQVIEAKGVSCGYERPVVEGLDWLIGPGDRYGILGENGVGKSTLLRVLCGKARPLSGTVRIGKSVRMGILSQRLDGLSAHDGERVRELLASYKSYYVVDGKEQSPEQLAERLGFRRDELMSRVGELSGGQRRRLGILCVLMEEPNVLVLDEPGNDLDTDMLAVLEDLLDTWPGTLLLVTHDRYLMERVCDDLFAIVGGRLRHVPGGVDEYLRILDEGSPSKVTAAGVPARAVREETAGGEDVPVNDAGLLPNAERRETQRRVDAVARRLERVSASAGETERELAAHDPVDYQGLMDLQEKVRDARAEAERLEEEWLELSERLERDRIAREERKAQR